MVKCGGKPLGFKGNIDPVIFHPQSDSVVKFVLSDRLRRFPSDYSFFMSLSRAFSPNTQLKLRYVAAVFLVHWYPRIRKILCAREPGTTRLNVIRI